MKNVEPFRRSLRRRGGHSIRGPRTAQLHIAPSRNDISSLTAVSFVYRGNLQSVTELVFSSLQVFAVKNNEIPSFFLNRLVPKNLSLNGGLRLHSRQMHCMQAKF